MASQRKMKLSRAERVQRALDMRKLKVPRVVLKGEQISMLRLRRYVSKVELDTLVNKYMA